MAACVVSPLASAVALAAHKAYRVTQAGHRVGNETIAVALFAAAELFVIASLITLPAIIVCVVASMLSSRVAQPVHLLAFGALAVIFFGAVYALAWQSVELRFAIAWAFAFFAWPLLLRRVTRRSVGPWGG